MSTDTVIIGCCGANLASLAFALQRLGCDAPISEDPERVRRASHVILPGVGAADDAMSRLERAGFSELVPTLTQPVLGICLGMQLLFAASAEDDARCLGIIPERVSALPHAPGLPVPHMGWNQLEIGAETTLLRNVASGDYAYFVHSYAAPVGSYTRATADYGVQFSSVVEQDNFFGTQFHPERSSALGAVLLANFLGL
ncbi:imidazole glycerol phosphate synthase subunit HisH [Candidatus Rariloculus sp.]|uniref:imidazole glycerol phosphate synthase subunit HisH n=1 Tax=Candidatus Rariloculus sp. TaxID=3101265 RepID=UPI003D10A3E5